jgi:lactoylglutathione lyase
MGAPRPLPMRMRPQPRRFGLLTLYAEDLLRSVVFYRDVLGLPTSWRPGSPYAEFRHEGIRFAIFPRQELDEMMGVAASHPYGINGTFSLAIEFPDPVEVDAEYLRLRALGIVGVYEPRDEPWGMRSAMLHDPDGNLIELVAWLPEAG